MNDRPNPTNFANFGPPPVSGTARLLPWLKTLAAGGLLATVSAMALQLVLPDGYRPSDIAGRAAGSAERHEMLEKQATKLAYERGLADATAQANAKAQADLLVQTKVLEERTASLAPVSAMAGIADFGCMAAKIVSGLTQPKGWGRQSSDDVYDASQRVGAVTCNIGNAIRQGVTESQIESVRTAAAARGAPMTNGAMQASASAQSGQNSVTGELFDYAMRQPPEVYTSFSRGLASADGSYWPMFYRRVAAYRDAHSGN